MAGNYNEDISNNLDEIRKELRIANQLKLADIYLADEIRTGMVGPWVIAGRQVLETCAFKLGMSDVLNEIKKERA